LGELIDACKAVCDAHVADPSKAAPPKRNRGDNEDERTAKHGRISDGRDVESPH
jgi:hypothetical protein